MKPLTLVALALVACAGLAAGPKPASAMSYSYRAIGSDTVVVDAVGEITYDEEKTLRRWVNSLPRDILNRPYFAFVLDSPGGNPFGAYRVGEAIRKQGGNTGVAENGACTSSCVIIWAAGILKSVSSTSRIGVHGAYFDRDKMSDSNEAKTAPLVEATTTLEIAQQLHVYGAPDHVVVQTIMTPSTDIYWLTMKDAADWGANIVQ